MNSTDSCLLHEYLPVNKSYKIEYANRLDILQLMISKQLNIEENHYRHLVSA